MIWNVLKEAARGLGRREVCWIESLIIAHQLRLSIVECHVCAVGVKSLIARGGRQRYEHTMYICLHMRADFPLCFLLVLRQIYCNREVELIFVLVLFFRLLTHFPV